jgi:integrase/recombinase XerD
LYALIVFIIDTGCRIDECLSLKRSGVDIDNFLVTVRGKGNKERIIPISRECRRVLYRFIDKHNFDLVFPTRQGAKYSYRNSVRDFKDLCKELGITDVRTSWHTLRHGFAINHVRQGGDVFSLQRMMGHSSLDVTKRYVNLTEDDLKLVHKKTSILGRLK